jgi:acyl-CoA thioesterase
MRKIREYFKNDRFAALRGIELPEASEERARAEMPAAECHLNGVDLVHGGAVFPLADLVFAAASSSHCTAAVVIRGSIWHAKAVKRGTLFAEAWEVPLKPKLATYSSRVTDDDGEIIAVFEGMVYRKKEPIAP